MNRFRNAHGQRNRPHATLSLVLAGAVLALAACASTPPPTEQIAASNAALARAESAGGAEFAPGEMAMARDKMTRANRAMTEKKHDTALTLAQQAQLDAQLAQSMAEAGKARKSAVALQDASRALNEEMTRKAP